jgi:hypothetical protein
MCARRPASLYSGAFGSALIEPLRVLAVPNLNWLLPNLNHLRSAPVPAKTIGHAPKKDGATENRRAVIQLG